MNTQRKTLVLLHGHGMDDTIWGQLSVLLSEYYTVVHPNFSLFTFCRSLDDYADELHRLLTNAGIKTFTLVGHSMGGYIGLAFAQKYPEMLEGFVLFHSTAFADDDTKKHQRDQMILLIRKHGAAAFVKHTAANLYGERYKELFPEAVQQHIEQFGGLPSEALAVGMEAMRDRPDRTAVLTQMPFPVLFLIGMRDQLVPFERSIELVGYAKQGFPFILAEAGHMAMIERPDAIFRILRWYMDTKIGQS
jgi:pimeloyl-ACP methyl ester carboxylesterase